MLHRSSYKVRNERRDADEHQPVRLHGFRFPKALASVARITRVIQTSIAEKFAVLRPKLEKPVELLSDPASVNDVLVSLGLDAGLSVTDYSNCVKMYDFVRERKVKGLSKRALWVSWEFSNQIWDMTDVDFLFIDWFGDWLVDW